MASPRVWRTWWNDIVCTAGRFKVRSYGCRSKEAENGEAKLSWEWAALTWGFGGFGGKNQVEIGIKTLPNWAAQKDMRSQKRETDRQSVSSSDIHGPRVRGISGVPERGQHHVSGTAIGRWRISEKTTEELENRNQNLLFLKAPD